MLEPKTRYLQLAFNYDLGMAQHIIPTLPKSRRILIEAGTPFIKREGMRGVQVMRSLWAGDIVADLKTMDGAANEVLMARQAGATAVTVLGNSPPETLNLFIEACRQSGLTSMIDMIGVSDPLRAMLALKGPPDVIILHLGRDEENTRGKVIEYKHVTRIHSKYSVLISAAGGVGLKEARSAIFNGADIVIANLVRPGDPWEGISTEGEVNLVTQQFLATIE
jgi:bifunctional enzyme Fae/Hps